MQFVNPRCLNVTTERDRAFVHFSFFLNLIMHTALSVYTSTVKPMLMALPIAATWHDTALANDRWSIDAGHTVAYHKRNGTHYIIIWDTAIKFKSNKPNGSRNVCWFRNTVHMPCVRSYWRSLCARWAFLRHHICILIRFNIPIAFNCLPMSI